MKSVISELWNGEIAPCEHCGAQDGLANILFSKRKQGRETMEKILPEERRDVLESYRQLWEDYLLRMMETFFSGRTHSGPTAGQGSIFTGRKR